MELVRVKVNLTEWLPHLALPTIRQDPAVTGKERLSLPRSLLWTPAPSST